MREKMAKTQAQLNEARKLATYWEEMYNKLLKSTRATAQKEHVPMSTSAQKQSILALAAAAGAMASAAQALAATYDDETPTEPAKPEPVKPAKKAPAAKPAETPAAAAPAAAPAAAAAAPAATNGAGDLMAQCRSAAKSYAEVYGREGLKEVLGKFTQGTLADVAPEKLPELLKALS